MNTHRIERECSKSSLVNAMMKRIKFILLLVTFSILLLLSSCIDRLYGFETDYSTGVPLTPEMIESIIDAATLVVEEIYPTETDSNGNLVVYWLSGGSVWHASKACSSVDKANNAQSGTIADAVSYGKDRPCKICAKDIEYSVETHVGANESGCADDRSSAQAETQQYPKNYSEDGKLLVYWTKSGSVWHESSSCSSLVNTAKDSLICGSEEDALFAGKERACKKCS